jgi:hypothetical protein
VRRRRPEADPTFEEVLLLVERAKAALVSAVPPGRGDGVPVSDAVLAFESDLRRAASRMAGWRHPQVESEWAACRDAVARSIQGAERLRLEAPALDYESLVSILGDLIAPLEAFEDADRAVRALTPGPAAPAGGPVQSPPPAGRTRGGRPRSGPPGGGGGDPAAPGP